MDDREAIAALVSDLHWQIDQFKPRGIKDKAGNPYNPSYYKRGLKNAIASGGLAVAEFVKSYLTKPPSAGYKKLEEADSLDLACEALIADESKPYAHLFTPADREAARARLAPYFKAIEERKAARQARIVARGGDLPDDLSQLGELATKATEPEDSIAINSAILRHTPNDVVALIRLGRAQEAIGSLDAAEQSFQQALAADPGNPIAVRRLGDIARRR